MVKTLVLTFLAQFYSFKIFSQSTNSYIANDSIKYTLIFSSPSAIGKMKNQPSKYRVLIDMPRSIRDSFTTKSNDYWFEKLKDTTSDWAAVLILYYLHDQDAFIIKGIEAVKERNNENLWISVREKELDYWINFLRSREKKQD